MKFRRGIYNIIFGFSTQIIILALGIIVPRLILVGYGSETNGLLNTVTQIYSYVALLEAGIGTATIQALYKPITQNDKKEISGILVATRTYYRKITFFYFLCVIALALVSPFAISSNLDKKIISLVVLFNGLAGVITFYYVATFKQLLIAEGKNYITSNITFAIQVCSYLVKIVLANLQVNVVYLQLSYLLINVLQVAIYQTYFKKKYNWIDYSCKPNNKALKQKNAFLIHEITLTVFNSTDTIVLSTMCGLTTASIYAVYNLVFSGLQTLISTLFNSIKFSLGQTYHENREKYIRMNDAFDGFYLAFVFSLISVCYFLILPFISLYTKGVSDANYLDSNLPFLFCMIQLLSASRAVSSNLINVAQHARETVWRSILEAVINIVVSIFLVKQVGIYGVLLGTIIALLYRTNDMVIYANTKILKRLPVRTYCTLGINFILFFGVMISSRIINIQIKSYAAFVVYGVLLTIIMMFIYFMINIVLNSNCQYYAIALKNKFVKLKKERC